MGIPCKNCGRSDVQTFTVPIEGGKSTIYLCADCYKDHLVNLNKFESNANQASSANEYATHPTGWTGFLKTINIVCAVIITIAGFIIGANIADAVSYNDGGVVLGSLLGGVIGLIVGLISIALSMVIAEISDTLKDIRDELKNKK